MSAKDRRAECEKMMKKAVEERSPSMLKDLLEKAVVFRNFSPRNSILIAQQCPEATIVMGKKAWERFGVKPRNENGIVITGMVREFLGDGKAKKEWLGKNPFRNIDMPELLPARLYALRNGAKPTEEELEMAERKEAGFTERYLAWESSKPESVKTSISYVPVRVYDISQCEIVDEEKFRQIPKPSMKTEMPEKLFPTVKEILEEAGYVIDDTSATTAGKAVRRTILIDGQADEDEKLFQIVQAWASTKAKEIHEAVIAAAMFLLYTGNAKTVSDSVLETVFLKAKTLKAISHAITKAGSAFREMAKEFEEFVSRKFEKEIQAEDIELGEIY